MFTAPSLPRPLPPAELLGVAEMAAADRAAMAQGTPGLSLMEAAGRAVARAVMRLFPPQRVLVLAGPGNNGGDGYVAARYLLERGWPVAVAPLAPPRAGSDAAEAARLWRGPTVPFDAARAAAAGLVIDAVFGAGLDRPLAPEVRDVLAAAPLRVAIDVPSGVDGDTGADLGAAPAVCTVTFFRFKPGHWLFPGRRLCGRLILADIGIPESVLGGLAPKTLLNTPRLWTLPRPAAEDHKYRRGVVGVWCGEMPGAALLAAEAARRGGAGLVRLHTETPFPPPFPGLIVTPAPPPDRAVIVAGPGLGLARARALIPSLLAARRPLVCDADALTAFAGTPEALRGAAVLTPHEGEFTRLFGPLGADRLAEVREAARRTGAVVLLKGASTLIAAPDGRAAISAAAPPTLATAGSGDVLSGLIGALLAQGMEPFTAALAAAWLHGRAAVHAPAPLIAEDLLAHLPAAFAEARQAGDDGKEARHVLC
jgi:hydroxyethylthiazole kinase-like uncharacterized protein yjeF